MKSLLCNNFSVFVLNHIARYLDNINYRTSENIGMNFSGDPQFMGMNIA